MALEAEPDHMELHNKEYKVDLSGNGLHVKTDTDKIRFSFKDKLQANSNP